MTTIANGIYKVPAKNGKDCYHGILVRGGNVIASLLRMHPDAEWEVRQVNVSPISAAQAAALVNWGLSDNQTAPAGI